MKCLQWCGVGVLACALTGAPAQTLDHPPDEPSESELSEPSPGEPEALPLAHVRLLHFDSRAKIPGAYYVQYKSVTAFERVSSADTSKFEVLPTTLPLSRAEVEMLSEALAARVNAKSVSSFSGSLNGFTVEVDSDDEIAKLAEDKRIDFIEPVMRLTAASFQQTLPANNSLWHLDRIDQRQLPLACRR